MDLIGKQICPEKMDVLYAEPFSKTSLARDFEIMGGEWYIRDEWLTGISHHASGVLISRMEYNTDVLLEFHARTLLPSTHDIDVMWNGSWDREKNVRSNAYVLGIEGWWDGKLGFEKAPDNGFCAVTPLFSFEPGRVYHVQCGSINGHLFCALDGKLMIEAIDPSPIDVACHGLVGFEAYSSQIQFKDFVVKRADYIPLEKQYKPEF
jgi:hypothetical protein